MVGAPISPSFCLTDHLGAQVTEHSYRGGFQLVYFGFTSCRVVCPRALGKLSSILDSLGDKADAIKPLYITVDPARDTPEVMRRYLESGYPRFTGLTGPESAIEEAKASFRVFAQRKADALDPDGYQIAHTAIAYFLGQDGEYLDHFSDATAEEQIIARIIAHLQSAGT